MSIDISSKIGSLPRVGAGLRRCNNDGGWEDSEDTAAADNVVMWGVLGGIAGLSESSRVGP